MIVRMKTISIGAVDRAQISATDGNDVNRFTEFFAPNYGDQTHWYYWDFGETQGSFWTEGNEYVIYTTTDEDDSTTGVTYQVYGSEYTGGAAYDDCNFRGGSPIDADGVYVTDGSSSTYLDARIKYFAILKNTATEPYCDSYGAYGVEEQKGEVTTTTTTITMITYTELWGFNTAFVILGLVMVPASGLYLVHGGKDNMSRDKLFFGLVAFFIGWAFIIGVTMP
jgi:hypothetical protein